MALRSATNEILPALDLIDLLDFIAHSSQVVIKHSGVVLTECLANSDLRPLDLIDTSGVDKNFVQNFLLKHANGILCC